MSSTPPTATPTASSRRSSARAFAGRRAEVVVASANTRRNATLP
jgi:hypothetical protein